MVTGRENKQKEKWALGRKGAMRNCIASAMLSWHGSPACWLRRREQASDSSPQNKTTVRKLDKNCPTVISRSGNHRQMIKKFLEKLLELRVTPARGHKHCLWQTPTCHVIPAPTPPLIPQFCRRELRFYQDRAMRTSSYATRRGKLNLGH